MAKSLWKNTRSVRRTMELVGYGTLAKGAVATIAAAVWGWIDGLAPSVIGVLSLVAGATVITALVLTRRRLYPLSTEQPGVGNAKALAPAVSTKVVATKEGFDGLQRRHPGDVFTMMLVPGEPFPTWLELADTPLTAEERFEIEFVRATWYSSGHHACRCVTQVLDKASP